MRLSEQLKVPLMGAKEAKELSKKTAKLCQLPPNKVLLAVYSEEVKSESGLIMSTQGTDHEEFPKKGVVIQVGAIDEEYKNLADLDIGQIITHGMYSGKEIIFQHSDKVFEEDIRPENYKLTILSVSEILMVEFNIN